MSICSINQGLSWRSCERQAVEEIFGGVCDFSMDHGGELNEAEYYRWFPASEDTTKGQYSNLLRLFYSVQNAKHINPVTQFQFVQDKPACLREWASRQLPIPKFFQMQYEDVGEGFELFKEEKSQNRIEYPCLVRLSNGVAGQCSLVVESDDEALEALISLHAVYKVRKSQCAFTSMMCVEFVETSDHAGYRASHRIIVAGDCVVTGYARVCEPPDWVAITGKFTHSKADSWISANKECEQLIAYHEKLFVNAVQCLGLHLQSIDVIKGTAGKLYLLEVQPTYDAGFAGCSNYQPPYYNPTGGEIVEFLKSNIDMLKRELPLYVDLWLDKLAHFRKAYTSVKRVLDA